MDCSKMLRTGLVVSNFGRQIEIEDTETGESYRCHLRSGTTDVVTGDIVQWRQGEPAGVVESRSERSTELQRPDDSGNLRTIAANIDLVVLVVATRPECHSNLVDRYLVAAEVQGIQPVILLNKADLLDTERDAETIAMLARLEAIGYEVLYSSSISEHGLTGLQQRLQGHTAIFFGQSGVGKSSLVNALLPGSDSRVGELSEANEKGKHTTTTARLYHLPGGGTLIDSPGVREFSMVNLNREQLEYGFIEFRPLFGTCKFRNCSHRTEPGCALLAALEKGEIFPQRWDSYQHILGSLGS